MRISATWSYYGVGILCLGASVWLVVSPPQGGRQSAPHADEPPGATDRHDHRPSGANRSLPSPVDQKTGSNAAASILPAPQIPPAALPQQDRMEWIEQYCAQLAEYSYRHDTTSLEIMLAELGSAELEIAEAAYHNLMARHDRRAIPYLEARISDSSSAFEKRHLQELIEFLETKSILESDLPNRQNAK